MRQNRHPPRPSRPRQMPREEGTVVSLNQEPFLQVLNAGLETAVVQAGTVLAHTTAMCHEGHIVSVNGIATDPEKTACVRDWPTPKSVGEELKRFQVEQCMLQQHKHQRDLLGFQEWQRILITKSSSCNSRGSSINRS
ncbi:unnamed protein product [Lampetra planeri]